MSLVISLMIALSALTMGASNTDTQAPTQALTQATQALSQAPQIEEDDPAFRCAVMGNKVCSPVMTLDAQATLEDSGIDRDPANGTLSLEYLGHSDRMSQDTALGEFCLESLDFPGEYHYYRWVVISWA
jgi:hypothetical protein